MKPSFINRTATATALNISPRTLEKWAVTGEGPPFYKLGGRVLYDIEDIETWVSSRRRSSTSQISGEGKSYA